MVRSTIVVYAKKYRAEVSDLYISASPWASPFPDDLSYYLLSLIIYKYWDNDTAFGSRSVHDFILLSPGNSYMLFDDEEDDGYMKYYTLK